MKERKSHVFEREQHDHYVEERWVSERLFENVLFKGPILDPCCGWGRIPQAAMQYGLLARGSDVVNRVRDQDFPFMLTDFLSDHSEEYTDFSQVPSVVCNPPFNKLREFAMRALWLTGSCKGKVAMIFPARRLAAARWLRDTPLSRVLYLSPRPSMPTGSYILKGGKVGGGTQDFCWLIWNHNMGNGTKPSVGWLVRDEMPHI